MLNVYLDQNKWIDLARADRGRDTRFRDVLDLAVEGARRGLVRFPLSSIHYMELWNHRRGRRRHELAATMLELARPGSQIGPNTIAGLPEILPMELDLALRRWFGRPLNVRVCNVFGQGANHAFGKDAIRYKAPWLLPLSEEQRSRIEYAGSRLLEAVALAGPAQDLPIQGIDSEKYKVFSQRFAERETKLVVTLRELRATKRDRARWLAGLSFIDMIDPLRESMLRAGVGGEEFEALGSEGLTEFLRDVPTRHVDYELHRLRHDNPQMKRVRGDLDDIVALSIAVVYCDVVVTERLWVDLIRRAKLDTGYNTTMLVSLDELAPVMVTAA